MELITNGLQFDQYNEWTLKIANEIHKLDERSLFYEKLTFVATNFMSGKSITTKEIVSLAPNTLSEHLYRSLDNVEYNLCNTIFSFSRLK
jgi:hypothetical protein